MKLVKATAIRVKNLLEKRGLTQYSLYKMGGIPRSTTNDVVNCKKKRVSSETIYQMCSTLGISMKEFYDDPIFDEVDD